MPKPKAASCSLVLASLLFLLSLSRLAAAQRYSVATFNVENYLLADTESRRAKPESSRSHVAAAIVAIHPDVIALEEVGGEPALLELQARLHAAHLELPRAAIVHGPDTNIQIAILSRFPIVRIQTHTNDSYLLDGRRRRVARGFLEAEIAVTPRHRIVVLAAHLKSKRVAIDSAESELRENEARLLREHVDEILRRDPDAHLLVCGDLNDTQESRPIRLVMGTGARGLVDTRPFEPNGDSTPATGPRQRPRRIAWTHHFGQEDTYSRIDYLLMSRGLAREWRPEGTRIHVQRDWGLASDHRPIVAEFEAEDR